MPFRWLMAKMGVLQRFFSNLISSFISKAYISTKINLTRPRGLMLTCERSHLLFDFNLNHFNVPHS